MVEGLERTSDWRGRGRMGIGRGMGGGGSESYGGLYSSADSGGCSGRLGKGVDGWEWFS